ncbi:MAG TPA: ImmA/IrrE family metallo-endopeptidase, partial [Chloroflexota bacterium]|nr:ImmA/IrrE family metallo-endopeptidase [Chloroflexota bacterium]
ARKSSSYLETSRAQVAWLCRAKQLAKSVTAGAFSGEKLQKAVQQLRSLVADPEAIGDVPRILSEAGIRMVIVEPLAGSKIDGAVFWIDHSPVIALSLRYQRIDSFWFTLFHELGHIESGDVDLAVDVDIDRPETEAGRPPSERTADLFASETLIPAERLESFINQVGPYYSARQIEEFARQLQVHPGIVVGQLQHRGKVPYTHFRKTLTPIRQWIAGRAPTDGWGAAPAASA